MTTFESDLWLSDESILELGVKKEHCEAYRRAHYQRSFGVPTWYPQLKEHTFRSEVLDLARDQKEALGTFPDQRTPEHLKTLQALADTLDQALKEHFPEGAFVKLNTRSPKDVPVYDTGNEKLWEMVQRDIESVPGKEGDLNHLVWSFIKSTTRIMKISCGKDAVDLLSRSTRIQEDIRKMLLFGDTFPVQIILRQWLPECPERPEYEFRGFVYKKQLNALSMYFCCAYSEELHKRKLHVQQLILDFFESIKDRIQQQNFVIDFYVTSDDKVKVVELNPFHIGAGACLFTWRTDRELFMNGPFTFKVIEEQNPEISKEIIPIKWKKMIDSKYAPKEQPQQEADNEICIIS